MTEVQRKAEAEKEKQRQLKLAKKRARPKRQRRLIRLPVVEELTDLKKSEIYERAKAGLFPRQVPLGQNTKAVGWVESEIFDYIDDLIRQRDEMHAKRGAFPEGRLAK